MKNIKIKITISINFQAAERKFIQKIVSIKINVFLVFYHAFAIFIFLTWLIEPTGNLVSSAVLCHYDYENLIPNMENNLRFEMDNHFPHRKPINLHNRFYQ